MNEDEGTLAYGASDGSVGLIKISQRLKQSNARSSTPQYDIEVAMEISPRLVYEADGKAGVALKWVPIAGRSVGR
jgi:general transcription factor 3C protein 4